jgi:hypothetical protein
MPFSILRRNSRLFSENRSVVGVKTEDSDFNNTEWLRYLGWVISTHRVNGTIELHAILRHDPDQVHVARCSVGEGAEEEYRPACLWAQVCGEDVLVA